ncbi:MAG: aminotransferase class IV [Planctomycetota bacterium]|nr:aminotransferase class IV [Planctomycetota bacterium]
MNDPSRVAGACGWIDGVVLPVHEIRLSAFDRTLLYGLGAFETVRLFGGKAYLLDRHLARLKRSLGSMQLPIPKAAHEISAGLSILAERNASPEAMARITVTAGTSSENEGTGAAEGDEGMHVIIGLREVAPVPPHVVVGVTSFAPSSHSPLAGVKSTNYLVHYMLRERAEAEGRTDDLMVDANGHITEATVANVFCVAGGRLLTPPVSHGILPGVTRARVLELAADEGLGPVEEPLHRSDLKHVDECFLTGAGKCLLQVDTVDGRALPKPRPYSARLRTALARDIAMNCAVPQDQLDF